MTTKTDTASIMSCLQADHERLDGLMKDTRTLLGSGDAEGAAAFFKQFRKGLLRHIEIEEGLLFPAFESATGMQENGPTSVMRHEHTEIKRLLGLIEDLFEGSHPDAGEFESLRSALVALLHEHNQKEERILYPMCDRLIDIEGRRDILTRMEGY